MERLHRRLLAAALSSALLAFAGPGGKKGGGGNDGPPSELPVIANFWPVNAMESEGGPYADNNLNGGWSNMPGSGNFTLALEGSGNNVRYLWMDFSDPVNPPNPPETLDPSIAVYEDDPGNPDNRVLVPLFLSMNQLCSGETNTNGDYLHYDPDNEACNDGGASDGSLKAMTGDGPDLLVNFRASFPDPLDSKAQIRVHCGPVPSNRVNEEQVARTPDPIRATCELGRSDDDACLKWRLTPDTPDGSLRCSVFRRKSSGRDVSYTGLGIYNMPLDLILQRDENGDGVADLE